MTQRARSSCLRAAAFKRAFGYTRACSRSPIPRSPRIAIGAAAPQPDRRRALELLAGAPEGCTDGLMFANGLATTHAERMVAGGKSVEVAPIKITEVGRRALAR